MEFRELDEESVKRQKLEDNAEKAELQRCLEIVPRDDEAINIIRADGSEKYYKIFTTMLDDFDRQDMLDLYRLVKERFETTSPKGYDRLLWGDLVTLFEPSEEDEICRAQQDYTLISWRLFDSCGIHLLLTDTRITIHMMAERKYPLTQEMLSRMLSRRLEVDHECEMAYELLRFTRSQLKKKYSNSLLLLVVKLLLLVLVTTARRVSAVSYKSIQVGSTKLEQFQVNTKFLNSLPPEWSKFMTDVKLIRDLHTTNFDQLYAYLEQHELHANEVRLMRESNQDPLVLVANHQMTPSHYNTYQSLYNNPEFQQQFSPSQSPQYGSIHPTQHYSTTYPSTPLAITYPTAPYPNAYSSTVHQEACPQPQYVPQIEYTVSTVNQQTYLAEFPQIESGLAVPVFKQGDDPINAINKMMSFITRANILGTGGNNSGQQRVMKYFNCQGEGHMARQCLKPKRKRDATWFRDKVLLIEAQGSAKAVLMANLSSYGSDVLSEGRQKSYVAGTSGTRANTSGIGGSYSGQQRVGKVILAEAQGNGKVLNEEELEFLACPGIVEGPVTQCSHFVEHQENEIHSDSNIIPYSQYLIESQNAAVQDTNSSTQQDALILSVFEQLSNQVTNCNKVNNDNLIVNESLSGELERYKEWVKLLEKRQNVDLEKESLTKTFNVFKNESKEREARNIDEEIALEKKVKELDNI
ncbi:hypothetical protein Tco_0647588, partial [Tanacetum coccineum]